MNRAREAAMRIINDGWRSTGGGMDVVERMLEAEFAAVRKEALEEPVRRARRKGRAGVRQNRSVKRGLP